MAMAMTVQQALGCARARIEALDAQALLCALLGVERAYLFGHPDHLLTPAQADRYAIWVERCAAGEPLAYILGRRAFYDRDFIVTPDVLIPRPETELLVEQGLAYLRGRPAATVADVGTGSGALAVTLAVHAPAAQVYALDISPAALAVARQNAAQHRAAVTFLEGDLLRPFLERGLRFDLLVANLPYIASGDLPSLAVTRWEPRLALDGGADGLDLVRRLLDQAPAAARPGARLLLEIGADQGAAAQALGAAAFPGARAAVLPDLAGHDRILRLDLP